MFFFSSELICDCLLCRPLLDLLTDPCQDVCVVQAREDAACRTVAYGGGSDCDSLAALLSGVADGSKKRWSAGVAEANLSASSRVPPIVPDQLRRHDYVVAHTGPLRPGARHIGKAVAEDDLILAVAATRFNAPGSRQSAGLMPFGADSSNMSPTSESV
jgi:hypothetical protein